MMILDFSAFPCTTCSSRTSAIRFGHSLAGRVLFPHPPGREASTSHRRTYPFPERVDENAPVDAEREANAEGPVDGDHVLVETHGPRGPARARVGPFRRGSDDDPPRPPSTPPRRGAGERGGSPGHARPRARCLFGADAAAWGHNGEGGREEEEVQVGRHGRGAGWMGRIGSPRRAAAEAVGAVHGEMAARDQRRSGVGGMGSVWNGTGN